MRRKAVNHELASFVEAGRILLAGVFDLLKLEQNLPHDDDKVVQRFCNLVSVVIVHRCLHDKVNTSPD